MIFSHHQGDVKKFQAPSKSPKNTVSTGLTACRRFQYTSSYRTDCGPYLDPIWRPPIGCRVRCRATGESEHVTPDRRLTDAVIRSLTPGERQADYWCVTPKGFGLRVSPGGRKTFIVRYRVAGRRRRVSLGAYPELTLADARRRARQVLGEVASGRDPAQVREDVRDAGTVGDLAQLYLTKHAQAKKRSWRQDRRIIENELLPLWRTRSPREIYRRDVRTLLEAIAERPAPIMANRVLALIRKMFNFAIARELVDFNPCAQLERPGRERQRDRVLTDEEIRTLWTKLEGEAAEMAAAFRLRLVTAQRGGEVFDMCWGDVDLVDRWWSIPGSDTKNELPHRVPLNDLAIEILTALRSRERNGMPASPYVLAGARGKRQRSEASARVGLADFRGHDLRRTAASRMASAGVPRLVIGRILNHVDSGVTAVYDRYSYDAEKQEALEIWCQQLKSILTQSLGTRS